MAHISAGGTCEAEPGDHRTVSQRPPSTSEDVRCHCLSSGQRGLRPSDHSSMFSDVILHVSGTFAGKAGDTSPGLCDKAAHTRRGPMSHLWNGRLVRPAREVASSGWIHPGAEAWGHGHGQCSLKPSSMQSACHELPVTSPPPMAPKATTLRCFS